MKNDLIVTTEDFYGGCDVVVPRQRSSVLHGRGRDFGRTAR